MIADIEIIHVGIRPQYKTKQKKHDIKNEWIHIETLPDGSKVHWTERMLVSGCNKVISETSYMGDLIYCPHCDEYFNKKQFKESER